jgi:hypothetical protein
MRRRRIALLAAGGLWLAPAHPQDDNSGPAPDLDFLEYLGSWQADDDEWWEIAEWDKDTRADPDDDDDEQDDAEQPDQDGRERDEDEDRAAPPPQPRDQR